jgi:hypothetical protein
VTGKFFSQRVQILHLKLDQYANFQCPGIIGSILECGLLLTFSFLPMPGLDTKLNLFQTLQRKFEKLLSGLRKRNATFTT